MFIVKVHIIDNNNNNYNYNKTFHNNDDDDYPPSYSLFYLFYNNFYKQRRWRWWMKMVSGKGCELVVVDRWHQNVWDQNLHLCMEEIVPCFCWDKLNPMPAKDFYSKMNWWMSENVMKIHGGAALKQNHPQINNELVLNIVEIVVK